MEQFFSQVIKQCDSLVLHCLSVPFYLLSGSFSEFLQVEDFWQIWGKLIGYNWLYFNEDVTHICNILLIVVNFTSAFSVVESYLPHMTHFNSSLIHFHPEIPIQFHILFLLFYNLVQFMLHMYEWKYGHPWRIVNLKGWHTSRK